MRRLCQCRPPAWSTIIALPALPRAKERLTGRGWRGSAREMPGFQFDRSLQQILDVFGSAIMQPPRFADFEPVLLPRLQFAFTVTFHIIFQSFTIGLSAFIATLLVHWIVTGGEHLPRLARFWTKIFAISFAMGVVSGVRHQLEPLLGRRRQRRRPPDRLRGADRLLPRGDLSRRHAVAL